MKNKDLMHEAVTKEEVVQKYNHQEESSAENLEDGNSESEQNDSISHSSEEGEVNSQGGYSYDKGNELEYYFQTLVEENNIQNEDMILHGSKWNVHEKNSRLLQELDRKKQRVVNKCKERDEHLLRERKTRKRSIICKYQDCKMHQRMREY